MGGLRGDDVLGQIEGRVALRNIGNDPATNVQFVFERVDPAGGFTLRPDGQLMAIAPGETLQTHTPHGIFPAHHFECTITYDGQGKRRYETRTSVHDTVLGEFRFRQIN
jgi:hypothetical protein